MLDRSRRLVIKSLAALGAAVPVFRPGTSVPAAAGPYLGAPPPYSSALRRPHAAGPTRRSLSASVAEGMAAELFSACAGGAVLTGWGLSLGCSTLLLGILGALPFFAQPIQLPAAWLSSSLGSRRVALASVAASRQLLLPLALLPFLAFSPGTKQAMFLSLAAGAAMLAVVGNNAWITWMSELVPARIRGRYFAHRTAMCTLAGTVGALGAGLVLDAARRRGHEQGALAGLALAASAMGLLSVLFMSRQHQPVVEAEACPRWSDVLAPLRDRVIRSALGYQVGWNAAVGLAASFFAVHMLKNLGMGYALVALHGAATAAVRMLAAPAWGRALDRVGARPVLIACSFGIAAIPLLWLGVTPDFLWPLGLDALLTGILWGGQALAIFQLPLSIAPRRKRAFHLGAFSAAGGVAFALASAAGGALADRLPAVLVLGGHAFFNLQALFLASSVARLGAAALALRIVEPKARSVDALWRLIDQAAARAQVPSATRDRTRRPPGSRPAGHARE